MKLKLLIADDEITSAKRIERKIDLAAFDITEVKYAEDGKFALDMCESWQPDILISDIVMPRLNGIDLATALKEKNENLQVIFISGYSDKKYLKNAIRLGAINYVEKPIDMEELTGAVKEAVKNLEDISRSKKQLSELETDRYYRMREQIARSISSTHYTDDAFAMVAEDYLAYENNFKSCVALTVSFLRHRDGTTVSLDNAKNIMKNTAESLNLSACIALRGETLVCALFSGSPGDYMNKYCDALLVEFTKDHSHFYMGVGRAVATITKLHDSYLEAAAAAGMAFYHEPDYISYYHISNQVYDLSGKDPVAIIHEVYSVSKDQMIFNLRTITSSIMQCEGTPVLQVKDFYFKMVNELLALSKKDGVEIWADYPSDIDLLNHIMSSSFLIHILSFLIDGIKSFYNYIEGDYFGNSTVDKIVRYVRLNYTDPDLSTESLVQYLNLSGTYISHLFKDVTGQNLKNYITDYRMKKAKELLSDATLSLGEIAVAVGYRNGNYFSSKFKEQFGLAPSEYKERKMYE
ncbi:MAG: response regulator [Lachnospiraceae bacterium]|nr:response regulator [Lachnospiraceae bacterium]